MEELFKTLVGTNIPTLLTISGIVLLFLALAGRFGAYIEIREERQKVAMIAGVLLLLAGLALHVYPTVLGPENDRASRDAADDRDDRDDRDAGERDQEAGQANVYWIQAGSFRTPGRAETFRQTLSNRLNRDPSVPDLEVQVFSGSVTGCVVDRVVVLPRDQNDADRLKADLDRVRRIVDDALLRTKDEVLNIQSACQ